MKLIVHSEIVHSVATSSWLDLFFTAPHNDPPNKKHEYAYAQCKLYAPFFIGVLDVFVRIIRARLVIAIWRGRGISFSKVK